MQRITLSRCLYVAGILSVVLSLLILCLIGTVFVAYIVGLLFNRYFG